MKALVQIVDPALRAELEARLAWWRISTVICPDVESAWNVAADQCPALFVVQWKAEDASTLDFCRRIRTEANGYLSTIWLVTDRFGPAALRAALDAGVDDCLSLPIDWQWIDVRLAAVKRRIADFVDRERVEEALRRSNERFDVAVRGANEGLWDAVILPGVPWNSLETPVWYSPRVKELLGFRDDEFPNVRRSWASRLHPDDRQRVMDALTDHVERRAPYDVEYRLQTKSGEYRWFSACGLGVWNDAGEMVRMAGSIRDVTDARQTADALKASEEKWRGLVENAPDYVLVVDREGRIQFINRVGSEYKLEEVVGASAYDFSPPEDRPRVREAVDSVLRTGNPVQLEVSVERPDFDADVDPDLYADVDAHVNPDLHADVDTHVNPDLDTHVNSDVDADLHPDRWCPGRNVRAQGESAVDEHRRPDDPCRTQLGRRIPDDPVRLRRAARRLRPDRVQPAAGHHPQAATPLADSITERRIASPPEVSPQANKRPNARLR